VLGSLAVAPSNRRTALVDQLRSLLGEGGNYNRLLVSRGDIYLHFIGTRGETDLVCEAVSNRYLPTAAKMTPEREALLEERGFSSQRKRRNPVRRFTISGDTSLASIADEAFELLALAYGVGHDEPLTMELHLGDADTTANIPLLRSMKKLARLRDMPSRQSVYSGLLESDLLLLLDPSADPKDKEPHVVERLQGFPVYAVFSDWNALRLWEPRGWPYTLISGAQLVSMAAERKIGSLMINPKGDIGGELLMNELAALAAAVRRRAN